MSVVSSNNKNVIIWSVFLLIFFIYLITAIPTDGVRDNPEFVDAVPTLGVAHPAGFPTYLLLGKAFNWVPFGSIPLRISLFSGLIAALTILFVFHSIQMLSAQFFTSKNNEYSTIMGSLFIAAAFGFSHNLWSTAVEAEVYSLNIFLISATWWCGIKWISGRSDAWLYAGGLLYGLAAGNHGTVAFYVPGFMFFFLLESKTITLRRFSLLILFFFIGFSVYLYLPIRAEVDPPINFGNPVNLERFITHVTDRKDSYTHFAGVRSNFDIERRVWNSILSLIPTSYWLIGFPFTLFGMIFLCKKRISLLVGLLTMLIMNYVFLYKWSEPRAFLPLLFSVSIFTGIGLLWFIEKVFDSAKNKTKPILITVSVILGILLVGLFYRQYPIQNQSDAYIYFEGYADDYISLPPDSIILTDNSWFQLRSYKDIKRIRDDVSVLTISDFVGPEFFNPISNNRFPDIIVPNNMYRMDNGIERIAHFIYENGKNSNRPMFMGLSPLVLNFPDNLIPNHGFINRITSEPITQWPDSMVQDNIEYIRNKLTNEFKHNTKYLTQMEDYYLYNFVFFIRLLNFHKQYEDALETYDIVTDIFNQNGRPISNRPLDLLLMTEIGITYFQMKEYDKAEKIYLRAIKKGPSLWRNWINLGITYATTGRPNEAIRFLQRAIELAPGHPEPLYNLASVYYQLKDTPKAVHYLQLASKCYDRDENIRSKAVNRLRELNLGKTPRFNKQIQ